MTDQIEQAADLIKDSEKIVVFTGAGVSTESGIPDFRSPGGLWSKYDPEDFTYQRFVSDEKARHKYWQMSTEFFHSLQSVKPNAAHIAIAKLEAIGKLDCLITQNIDGLHQIAGVSPERIIELHGTARSVSCLSCKKRYDRDGVQERIAKGDKAPRCDDCNGLLKPATISFGQAMPEQETAEALKRSGGCDLFIVIGSSLVVQPAASMPVVAKERGARLIIINREATPHDYMADLVIQGSAGSVLPDILAKVE